MSNECSTERTGDEKGDGSGKLEASREHMKKTTGDGGVSHEKGGKW